MTTTREPPHRAGALILHAITARKLKRAAVARQIGLSPKVFWQFLHRRPVPIDRFKALIEALQMTTREADALREAYITDASERAGRYRRAAEPSGPSRVIRRTDEPTAHPSLPPELSSRN